MASGKPGAVQYARRNRPRPISTPLGVLTGYELSDSILPFDLANITRDYGEDDARISIKHSNGATAHIWLHPQRATRFVVDAGGKRLTTGAAFCGAFPLELIVVPQLAPLEAKELLLTDETVNRNRSTRLAARNFRNIWYREQGEVFALLKERVERAWPGVVLQPPELVRSQPPSLEMYFEEDRITREIQWAGFGFQVWLQIHTHLLRGNQNSVLILDEPDIYLHPDLQHRLYHDVRELFPQYFLATHATEIVNEADTDELVIVNPQNRSAHRIKSESDYEGMLQYLGSAQNADFARISKVRRVLFVEGQDSRLLRRFAGQLNLLNLASDQTAPIFQLGGYSEWKRAKHAVWAFKEMLGIEISSACVFDRDYKSDEEIAELSSEMNSSGVACHVLDRKEIENYLLCPAAIARAINSSRSSSRLREITESVVEELIVTACEPHKLNVSAQLAAHAMRFKKANGSKLDESTIISSVTKVFEADWATLEGRVRLSPGKEVLASVFEEIKSQYGVSLTFNSVVKGMKINDFSAEFFDSLVCIDRMFQVD